jgi:hypothetical protein
MGENKYFIENRKELLQATSLGCLFCPYSKNRLNWKFLRYILSMGEV